MDIINEPTWIDISLKSYPKLTENLQTEIVIIGGGLTGVTAAYMLAKQGKKVILIEKYTIGAGETSNTTAFITSFFDTPTKDIEKHFGALGAKNIWKCGQQAIATIAKIVSEEKIPCEFTYCDAYIYALHNNQVKNLQNEAAYAQKYDIQASFNKTDDTLPFKNNGYLSLKNQAKFHPLKYLNHLAEKATEQGASIYGNTTAQSVKNKGGKVIVQTDTNQIEAKKVIVATHFPFIFDFLSSDKLIPYTTYVLEADIPVSSFTQSVYWDSEDPYTYFRIEKNEHKDRIILGGADHKVGNKNIETHPYDTLKHYLKETLKIHDAQIHRQWSGEIYESIDGIPLIGEYKENIYVATGFAGNGMTYGTYAASLITDHILGLENESTQLFNPKRFKNLKAFIKEGLHKGLSFTGNFIKSEISGDPTNIPNETGAVLRMNGKPTAIYKDENGTILKLSAFCTHMNCIINWNSTEKTWDCPCHGSRFKKTGEVLTGPANKPLERKN
jgi:glycine/D-amino acid oxidase-like deaminating enzyme/nitrite reductase/ring-hydroxylating ferredoxin subunit